ncbi:MBL fold metallo-hydrolase [Sandarakinorhabdus sp. AAP62]|uniref:MBL fold metallo-hydrolase n=1 Tax=Sandarakinorhabdus sp. AAP62 TaxID=1248916 RepID=UPI0002E7A156|nr:MBL fold metallo-hydrolase [Sandarakinorhabdus sp. AAP62]
MHTRRQLIAMAAGAALVPRRLAAQPVPDQLVLLGTGGGPTPKALRAAPAMALMIGGQLHIIDAGNGVARQAALAGLPLKNLAHVWITHLHNDHVADAFTLPWLAWSGALTTPVTVHGPRGMKQMARDWLRFARVDIETRMADEGRPDLRKMISVAEVQPGVQLDAGGLKVAAARVEHPPLFDSFAYRFDWAGKSVVWSGDTRPCQALIDLAQGADYLVQEVMYLPAMERLIQAESNAPSLRAHLLASHTLAEQAGEIAAAAGVKTLVLSHFVPGGDASVTDEMWRDSAARAFSGSIVVGRDLMRLAL